MTDQNKAAELSRVCAGAGISCQLADGGFYALTMLERDKPDAIISSYDVFDMSGIDFYEIVRSDDSLAETDFILMGAEPNDLSQANDLVLSANSNPGEIVKALKQLKSAKQPSLPQATVPRAMAFPKSHQISGTLEVLTLFDLMMSLNQNKHSGKLYLRINEEEAIVVLRHGEISHAEISHFVGEAALIQIFLQSEDSSDTEFFFERLEESPSLNILNSIQQSTKELLFKVAIELDHMREKVSSQR